MEPDQDRVACEPSERSKPTPPRTPVARPWRARHREHAARAADRPAVAATLITRLGYRGLFAGAAVFTVLGGMFVTRIRSVRQSRLRHDCDLEQTVSPSTPGTVGGMTQAQPEIRTSRRQSHLPALDGLRGLAILGVLLFHTGHLPGGFLGVDLFFALSGYLITDLLLREIAATGAVSLVSFWGRRVRRLLPALAVMLTVVTVMVWAVGGPDMLRSTLSDGPWVQANLVNWHLLAESASYWDRFGPPRVFEHLWSIAVEEQFYLVWPVLLLVIARLGRRVDRRVALVAAVIAAVSLLLMVTLVNPADPTRVYTGTDTRAFSLLLGGLVATGPVRDALDRLVGRWTGIALAVLAMGIGAMWLLVDGVNSGWLYDGGLFAHSLAAALLIGLCVTSPGTLVARVLAWQPLRWLGLISYSLYLWHWPVFVLLSPQRTGLTGWAQTIVGCAVSIGLATLSKYLVEDPIRFRARWARGLTGLLVFAVVMIGLAALWLIVPTPAAPGIDITQLS